MRKYYSRPAPQYQLYFTARRPISSMQFPASEFPPHEKSITMSFYDATVPAFLQILGALSGILGKAEAHCQAKNIQQEVLLSARLYPDMFPLTRQIQTACDFAAKGCARLTGSEVPSTPDTEKSFADLQARIAKTVEYVKAFKPAQFEGADARDVTFPAGPNNQLTLKGQQFLSAFAFPNFYFHAAIAHAILRHNGVELGKRVFLGVK
jgi:hypothetical protein